MALTGVQTLINLGMQPELAKAVDALVTAAVGAITPADITGFDAAVETAVADKTEIAALTGASDAAAIVAALQA
jgi:hypothetical protein